MHIHSRSQHRSSSLRRTHAWLGAASRTRRPGCPHCRRAAACRASGSSFLSAPTKQPAQLAQPRTGCVSVGCSYRVRPACGLVLAVELLGLRRRLFALDTLAAPAAAATDVSGFIPTDCGRTSLRRRAYRLAFLPDCLEGAFAFCAAATSDGLAGLRRYVSRGGLPWPWTWALPPAWPPPAWPLLSWLQPWLPPAWLAAVSASVGTQGAGAAKPSTRLRHRRR